MRSATITTIKSVPNIIALLKNADQREVPCELLDYAFNCAPWHAVCWHWQVNSNMPLASAQVALQYFFPSTGTQLQAGCAHLDVAFMEAPATLERIRTRTLQQVRTGESNKSVLFCSFLTKNLKPNSMATSMLLCLLRGGRLGRSTFRNASTLAMVPFLSKRAQLLVSCRRILLGEPPINK